MLAHHEHVINAFRVPFRPDCFRTDKDSHSCKLCGSSPRKKAGGNQSQSVFVGSEWTCTVTTSHKLAILDTRTVKMERKKNQPFNFSPNANDVCDSRRFIFGPWPHICMPSAMLWAPRQNIHIVINGTNLVSWLTVFHFYALRYIWYMKALIKTQAQWTAHHGLVNRSLESISLGFMAGVLISCSEDAL